VGNDLQTQQRFGPTPQAVRTTTAAFQTDRRGVAQKIPAVHSKINHKCPADINKKRTNGKK
jgi:hypothetical protein